MAEARKGEVRKLYVGNFPWETTEAELREVFSDFGGIKEVRIITNMDTGRSKGFGFVEMLTPREATIALNAMNDTNFKGRKLRVGYAVPKDKKTA